MCFLANAGLPMILVLFPAVLLASPVIVLVEAVLGWTFFRSSLERWFGMCIALNLASSLVGVPLAWLLALLIEFTVVGGGAHGVDDWWGVLVSVVGQAAWLVPYEDEFDWMVPVAYLVLLIPAYVMTVLMELGLYQLFFRKLIELRRPRLVFVLLNLCSYSLLVGYGLYQLIPAIIGGGS